MRKIDNINELTIDDIIDWCSENGEENWLKVIAKKKVDCRIYPRIKVNGKSVADKSQEPKIEKRPISFIQIRNAFAEKFMPEIIPDKKPAKESMYDRIAKL